MSNSSHTTLIHLEGRHDPSKGTFSRVISGCGKIEYELRLYLRDRVIFVDLSCTNYEAQAHEAVLKSCGLAIRVSHSDSSVFDGPYAEVQMIYEGNGTYKRHELKKNHHPNNSYHASYYYTPILIPVKLNVIQNLLSSMNVPNDMYGEIRKETTDFGGPSGRFVLKATDDELFYVHYNYLAPASLMLKTWMNENYDGVRDGQPLHSKCSSAALEVLLELLYLQKLNDRFGEVLVELLEVAAMWQMKKVLDLCTLFMQQQLQLGIAASEFDRLLRWFSLADLHSLDGGRLQSVILNQLMHLAENDRSKREKIEAQMVESYRKSATPEESAEMFMLLMTGEK